MDENVEQVLLEKLMEYAKKNGVELEKDINEKYTIYISLDSIKNKLEIKELVLKLTGEYENKVIIDELYESLKENYDNSKKFIDKAYVSGSPSIKIIKEYIKMLMKYESIKELYVRIINEFIKDRNEDLAINRKKLENIDKWFTTIYKNKELITPEIKKMITQNAEILMNKNNQLIFLPLRDNHIKIFRILYDKIKDVPDILELVDKSNNDGTLLTWLCRLNLNDLLLDCFNKDKINPINVNNNSARTTPLMFMIEHARYNPDTCNILIKFLEKYHKQQQLDIELLMCLPNIKLLTDIIKLYEGNEHLLVYDSILNSEILYDKTNYNGSEQQHINLIFEKILKKNEIFKHTNILMNTIKFNNRDIFDIIIKNPETIKLLIDKITPVKLLLICLQKEQHYLEQLFRLLIQEIDSRIIDEIILLFHSNINVSYLMKQLGISQSEIDCIYNKIITRPSHINLETINSSYKIPTYKLIDYLWTNSDRKQEKFEYVNSNTGNKYITEFGCMTNSDGFNIIREFIKLSMCKTRTVEYNNEALEAKKKWIKTHIAVPDDISYDGINFEYIKQSINYSKYIFYCYDYTSHEIICIGTVLKRHIDKSYKLDGLCVDSKYPGLGLSFMNYIKKIIRQINQNEETKIRLESIQRYETLRFYKDRAGFDFNSKDDHGKAILNTKKLFDMDITYKKYLKYKAKYMNLRKKLLT
jgi:hypothetical protein